MSIVQSFYRVAIRPQSKNEDTARRELIFNILIFGFITLAFIAFLVSLARLVTGNYTSHNVHPVVIGVVVLFLSLLYGLSKIHFNNATIGLFVGIYVFMGSYAICKFGYVLAEGLLLYVLAIVVAGVLISSTASVLTTLLVILILVIMRYLQINAITHPDTAELTDPLKSADLVIYIIIFIIILLVSWLSSREIERSLERARISEKLLKKERDNLEIRVRRRTRELEQIQAEKTVEMYKFAEYGRLSSSLIHDLASPLMSISMNFNELTRNSEKSELLDYINDGIIHMEDYVQSARNDLHHQKTIKDFDTKHEIQKVVNLHEAKIQKVKVKITLKLEHNLHINADSTKFGQLISNLLSNAIDALSDNSPRTKRTIVLSSQSEQDADFILITIQDSGSGIAADKLNTVFKPFYSTKPPTIGTGLGLSIVKRIVDENGGSINVESGEGHTTFYVKLKSNMYNPSDEAPAGV